MEVDVQCIGILRHLYGFLNQHWQHADRELLPDQGFETRLRETCILASQEWRVSQPWELYLGSSLETSSGTLHEIDLVIEHGNWFAIVEAKNWSVGLPTKNEVVVFFAKLLDYITCNPEIVHREICPVFVSTFGFEQSGLAACLGLGIHPIGPSLRPLPLLMDSMRRMEVELQKGLDIGDEILEEFTDFRAQLNQCSSFLQPTWFGERFGYQSDETIISRAVRGLDTKPLSDEFRTLNGTCSWLLERFRSVKASNLL